MLSRFLLILAGLFTGLWLRGAEGFLAEIGLPSLALLALILAVAAGPRATVGERRVRLEAVFGDWLDAWSRARHARGEDALIADEGLRAASHRVMLTAPDRVVRSMQAAADAGYSPAAVAQLVMEMRRGTGRVSVTLRPEQLEQMLRAEGSGRPDDAAPERRPHANPSTFAT